MGLATTFTDPIILLEFSLLLGFTANKDIMKAEEDKNSDFQAAGCRKSNPTKEEKETCTDYLLFKASLEEFLCHKHGQNGNPPWLNWTDNGCSQSLEYPLDFNFHDSCLRHDFGYRNYRDQGRFDKDGSKARIDRNFKHDLQNMCQEVTTPWYHLHSHQNCLNCTRLYYAGVKYFGHLESHVPRVRPFGKRR